MSGKTTTEKENLLLPPAFQVNSLGLPEPLFRLRKKLYIKAKREPGFRFYALYDQIYRQDVLAAAWTLVARNGDAPGVDRVRVSNRYKPLPMESKLFWRKFVSL